MKNQTKKVFAIIPSAGYGTRFDAALPKQYFNINEELIIEKTINHFLEIDQIEKIIIPLAEQDKIFSNLLIFILFSRTNKFKNIDLIKKKMFFPAMGFPLKWIEFFFLKSL